MIDVYGVDRHSQEYQPNLPLSVSLSFPHDEVHATSLPPPEPEPEEIGLLRHSRVLSHLLHLC